MDHSQTSSVSKVIIQCDHKVNCPAYICVKEAFFMYDYDEVADEYLVDHFLNPTPCIAFTLNVFFTGT